MRRVPLLLLSHYPRHTVQFYTLVACVHRRNSPAFVALFLEL